MSVSAREVERRDPEYHRRVDRTAHLAPSRALELRITPVGALLAQTSISSEPVALTPDLLLALLAFAGGVDRETALARLEERFGVERDAFGHSVEHLMRCGFLVPAASGDAPAVTGHFADVLRHVMMLGDGVRVRAYGQALAAVAPDKRVLDVGTGTGLLALLAARAGASAVIAVEESAIADLAAQVLAAAQERVVLVRRSSRDVELDRRVDVIVHELLGSDPLAEGLLPTICDARRRLLADGGTLVPHRLEVMCVGVDTRGFARDRESALATLASVETIADALGPVAAAVAALPARAFLVNLGDVPFDVLTEPVRLHDLDLAVVDEDACAASGRHELVVTRPGRLDAVVVYFRAHLAPGIVLTNAPDAPRTHWDRRLTSMSAARPVLPGDRVPIEVWRESALKHEQLLVDVAG